MGFKHCKSGFLLMEAIVAIFILAIFSVIIGQSWQNVASGRALAEYRMQALAIATDLIDRCHAGQLQLHAIERQIGLFSIEVNSNPLQITSVAPMDYKNPLLVTLSISWNFSNRLHSIRVQSIFMPEVLL